MGKIRFSGLKDELHEDSIIITDDRDCFQKTFFVFTSALEDCVRIGESSSPAVHDWKACMHEFLTIFDER